MKVAASSAFFALAGSGCLAARSASKMARSRLGPETLEKILRWREINPAPLDQRRARLVSEPGSHHVAYVLVRNDDVWAFCHGRFTHSRSGAGAPIGIDPNV